MPISTSTGLRSRVSTAANTSTMESLLIKLRAVGSNTIATVVDWA